MENDRSGEIVISCLEADALKSRIHLVDLGDTLKCKVCGGPSMWFCKREFGISGNDYFTYRRNFADTGIDIHYFRCERCRFLFSPSFSRFTREDFARFIYNDQYLRADPPFDSVRPCRDAVTLALILKNARPDLRILDYGGGSGALARHMRARGYRNSLSFDPIYDDRVSLSGKFDMVSCFEVIEHVQDQHEFAASIERLMAPGGCLILSTQVQPAYLEKNHSEWWYIQPRNGHLSLHSLNSLKQLFVSHGMSVKVVCQDLYAVYRNSQLPHALGSGMAPEWSEEICKNRNPLPDSEPKAHQEQNGPFPFDCTKPDFRHL